MCERWGWGGDRRVLSSLDLSRQAEKRQEVLRLKDRFISLRDTSFIKSKFIGGNISTDPEETGFKSERRECETSQEENPQKSHFQGEMQMHLFCLLCPLFPPSSPRSPPPVICALRCMIRSQRPAWG